MVVYVPDRAVTGRLKKRLVPGGSNLSPNAMILGLHLAGNVANRQVKRNLPLLRRVMVPCGVGGPSAGF